MWSVAGSPTSWSAMAVLWRPSVPPAVELGKRSRRRFAPIGLTMLGQTSCGSFARAWNL